MTVSFCKCLATIAITLAFWSIGCSQHENSVITATELTPAQQEEMEKLGEELSQGTQRKPSGPSN